MELWDVTQASVNLIWNQSKLAINFTTFENESYWMPLGVYWSEVLDGKETIPFSIALFMIWTWVVSHGLTWKCYIKLSFNFWLQPVPQ